MRDSLKRENKKDMELNITSMVISIQDNSKITNIMDMENINMLKDQYIRDFGSIIKNISSDVNPGMIMHNMLENSKMASEMEKGN